MGQTETKEKNNSKKQSSRIRTNFEIDLVSSKNEKKHKKNKKSYYQDLHFQKQVHNSLVTKKLGNIQQETKSSPQLKTNNLRIVEQEKNENKRSRSRWFRRKKKIKQTNKQPSSLSQQKPKKKQSIEYSEEVVRVIISFQSQLRKHLALNEYYFLKKQRDQPYLIIQKLLRMSKQRVDYKKKLNSYHLIQSVLKTRIQLKYHRIQKKRKLIAEEVLDTEKNYLDFLILIVEHFMNPLKEKKLITKFEIRILFNGIENILAFNEILKQNLQKVIEKWNAGSCLGKIFTEIIKFSKVYITYVNNYQKGLDLLQRLQKTNKKLKQFLRVQTEDPRCKRLDLQSMLIMPVQRLPRYVLFLEELTKKTPHFHEDFEQIKNALEMIKDVTTSVNEGKREFENVQKIDGIQRHLTPNSKRKFIISQNPSSKFVKSYSASLIAKKEKQTILIHLFTHQLLICKPKNNIFSIDTKYDLDYLIGFIFLKSITQDKKGKIALEFGKDSQETIHVACINKSDSGELFEKINSLSKQFQKNAQESSQRKTDQSKKRLEDYYKNRKFRRWRDVIQEKEGNSPTKK
ncbi:faciogenital dysplasia protein [Anaeramoeba flamelloides]|uniref:Faciogenital dysplasia protein n=1 Tax=Anaeramoeba flamelloides TaxID=1746091 RepID=A0ABQ8YH34_9EUKA|nr:faciogenital dysplasia protein [Anaeramoeba flamelloides]